MAEVALVVGLGRSGVAVARHLHERGASVVAIDDHPGSEATAAAARLGIDLVPAPDVAALTTLVSGADVVVPSPGVPLVHPVFGLASALGIPVRGEVELAFRWTHLPIVAVTGTNGKTTVTALIAGMLKASDVRAVAGGNIGVPLSDAVRRDVDVVVAEVSSFQLWCTDTFRPSVGVWLNLAADHLDWHGDVGSYAAAKARIWAHQQKSDLAVANADDPVVAGHAARAPGRVETFGLVQPGPRSGGGPRPADWRVVEGVLTGPPGPIMAVSQLRRSLPHDVANALAASAAAIAAGATVAGVGTALREFDTPRHRLTLVAEAGGVRWYDDSKATNPHAVLAALSGFESVVLLAGGRNKGLDLSLLAQGAQRVRAVVAIGESGAEVQAAFAGLRPVKTAGSMDEAVAAAASAARPGDAVLLSPGCASFDWYGSYAERGDDFARAVHRLLETGAADG